MKSNSHRPAKQVTLGVIAESLYILALAMISRGFALDLFVFSCPDRMRRGQSSPELGRGDPIRLPMP